MTKQQHIERHKLLHKNLDELVADWIRETEGMPSRCSLMEFLRWSHKQTKNPDDRGNLYYDSETNETSPDAGATEKPLP